MTETSDQRVLVVDDDPELLRTLARLLKTGGYDIDTASDGGEALAKLDESSFDVLLTDIAMPAMDGITLLRAVRERDVDLPVIFLTGTPSVETATRAVELGAMRYLTKPFEPETVLDAVGSAVRLHRIARAKREALDLVAGGGMGLADRTALEVRFERALQGLWMAFQPIVTWSTRRVYGYEALVRSREDSMPHPGALFDAAERLNRVAELGSAIRDLATRSFENAPPDAFLFVNLHTLDLNEVSLYLPTSPLSTISRRVVLEVTERASFDNVKNIRARIAVLRNMGFRIAIDDLGAGYAGLTSFAQLQPEVVKLDMSLVRDVQREPIKQRLIRSLSTLCRESGLLVVAEGIETESERDHCAELGCDLMQGYLFARPGPAFPHVTWGNGA